MSMAHSHDNTVPRPALIAAAALVGFSLLMTATVKIGWLDREAVPAVARAQADVTPARQRSLHFADQPDGAVLISDARTGATVSTIPAGSEQGGFIRGVLRPRAASTFPAGSPSNRATSISTPMSNSTAMCRSTPATACRSMANRSGSILVKAPSTTGWLR